MTDTPALSPLGKAALAYAGMGWRVFTLFPRSKKPMALCEGCNARLPAKDADGHMVCETCGTVHDGPAGLHLATTDKETVEKWWRAHPSANIGLATGNGLLVLDIDIPDPKNEKKTVDGEVALAKLIEQHGELPVTPRQRTGRYGDRRGWQYLFAVEGETRNTAGKVGAWDMGPDGKLLPSGLDTRGDGGYVVAHPSVHPSGVSYEWDPERRPSKTPLAPAPAWLLEALAPPAPPPPPPQKLSEVAAPKRPKTSGTAIEKWVQAALDGNYDDAAKAGPGTRNAALNKAAFKLGQLIPGGFLTEQQVRQTVQAAAEVNGWAAEEGVAAVEKVITSGMTKGIAAPREGPSEREPYNAPRSPKAKPELRVIENVEPAPDKKKRAKKEDDEGKPVDPTGWMIDDWEDHVEFKDNTKILAPKVVRNAIALLLYKRELADLFTLNKRNGRVIITRRPMWTANGNPYPRWASDVDYVGLQTYFETKGLRLNRMAVMDAVAFAAREREFDPVVDALKGFQWDGKERLDNWLHDYMDADDSHFVRTVGAKWLISAVARVLKPGSKADCVLVLEGPQGVLKSTALRVLAETLGPDCFTDRVSKLDNKDSMIELIGKVVVEFAELAAIRGRSADDIKRFLSAQDDDLRLPWDKTTTKLLRGCVFAGTVNPDGSGWLHDVTGNRRFWPVEVRSADIAALKEVAPQLWAEARARYEAGESWWLNEDDEQLAVEQTLLRMEDDVWAEKIGKAVRGQERVTVAKVLDDLGLEFSKITNKESRRVTNWLRVNGWIQKFPKDMDGKTVRVWVPPVRVSLFSEATDGQ